MEELDPEIKIKILVEAAELFSRYGIRSVTMDDIARHLSMSKKTIYQFFKDKDEIVTLGTAAHMEREKVEFEEINKNASNAIEELAMVCHCMRKHISELNPSLLYDLQKYHPKAWSQYLQFKNDFIKNSIKNNLIDGKAQGYFRSEIDEDVMAIFRVEQVQLTFNDQVFPKNQYDFKSIQMQFFDHFVYGIVTDKGRALYEQYLKENNV